MRAFVRLVIVVPLFAGIAGMTRGASATPAPPTASLPPMADAPPAKAAPVAVHYRAPVAGRIVD